jgi:small subunit ribosomal protein S11
MDKIAIVHIFASHNNTQLLLTDQTGAETIAKSTGGMTTKAQHKEGSPYTAMKMAEEIANKAKERGIRIVDIKVRGFGGIRSKTPGAGAEASIRSLTRNGLRIRNIENVTPFPHDGTRRKKKFRGKKK